MKVTDLRMPAGEVPTESASMAVIGVRVRPLREDDVSDVARIWVDSARYHQRLNAYLYAIHDAEVISNRYRRNEQYSEGLDDDDRVTLVAEAEDELVGFVDIEILRPSAGATDFVPRVHGYVPELAVAESWRGRGVGEALMTAADEWAQERGAEYMWLDVDAANEAAQRLYAKRGYTPALMSMIKRFD
jgi:ribosomal protein S18 acetylase RimI-like enzyme